MQMDDPVTITSLLLAAVSGLAGCVAFLYRQQVRWHMLAIEEWKRCQVERNELWKVIARMQNKTVDEVKRESNE